jgi:hypothetical protein
METGGCAFDARGVTHTSPGQRLEMSSRKIIRSAEGATHLDWSIPQVPFNEFHVVSSQEISIFFLESLGAMVLLSM